MTLVPVTLVVSIGIAVLRPMELPITGFGRQWFTRKMVTFTTLSFVVVSMFGKLRNPWPIGILMVLAFVAIPVLSYLATTDYQMKIHPLWFRDWLLFASVFAISAVFLTWLQRVSCSEC